MLVNRIVVVLLALGLVALAAAAWLVPQALLNALDAGVATARGAPQIAWWVVSMVGGALGLVVLVLELWPHGSPRLFEVRFEGGSLRYPAEAIAQLVERELAHVDGIHRARASISQREGRLDVHAWLATSGETDPQRAASSGAARVRKTLEGALWLPVRNVSFSIDPAQAGSLAQRAKSLGHSRL